MTGRSKTSNTAAVAGVRRGIDDRKQNTLVALHQLSSPLLLLSIYPFVSTVPVAERSRIKLK